MRGRIVSELAEDEVYTSLQSRLDTLRKSPTKENRGAELVSLLELTSRVQGRLFEALDEEGVDDRKIIPLMANGRLGIPSHRVSGETELKLAKENLDKTRELDETRRSAIFNETKLEGDLALQRAEARAQEAKAQALRDKLYDANKTLELTETRLNKTQLELKDTRVDNALLKTAPASYLSKYYPHYYPQYSSSIYDRYSPHYYRYGYRYGYGDRHGYPYYDYYLDREYYKSKYEDEYTRLRTDLALAKYRPLRSVPAIAGVAAVTNDVRRKRLIDRYADLFTQDRLTVQKSLRSDVSDEDTIKRIIYIAVVEAFKSAQRSFRDQRRRARNILSATTLLPTLEAEIQDYMVKNLDLYDPETAIYDVIRALETNAALPVNVSYRRVLRSMITALASCAYEMQTCLPELDIEVGLQGDVFTDSKFRRTFDAEFGAPLISAHLWPPLVCGASGSVVLKGEAATRHSVFSRTGTLRASRDSKRETSRQRTASPVRGRRTRSKSPVKGGGKILTR